MRGNMDMASDPGSEVSQGGSSERRGGGGRGEAAKGGEGVHVPADMGGLEPGVIVADGSGNDGEDLGGRRCVGRRGNGGRERQGGRRCTWVVCCCAPSS
jgi:hypothetical protein